MAASTFDRSQADREKRLVAVSSVLAALLLTGLKFGVGIWTNSLSVLSQATDSGLDLVAAGVTLWAVRAAGRPADRNHPYGHGKFENLSALFETGLLLLTCGWIIFEACRRLFVAEEVQVDPSVWAFGVIIFSIIVDISRSRALARVGRKYQSQALEADALHFSTDIYSSLIVLLGLGGVWAAKRFGLAWLVHADALAGLCVAMIVVCLSLRLGKRAFDELSDAVDHRLRDEVFGAAAQTPGVEGVTQARLRRSGPEFFVDLTVTVPRTAGLEEAHDVSDRIEESVRRVLPGADVVVHIEPVATDAEDLVATILLIAGRCGVGAHSIRVYQEDGRRAVEMHVEVDPALNIEQAHEQVTAFERDIRRAVPDVKRIVTHIEPAGAAHAIAAEPADEAAVREAVDGFLRSHAGQAGAHRLEVKSVDGELTVSLHLTLERSMTITAAHDMTGKLEQFLRRKLPRLRRVVIHVEPASK